MIFGNKELFLATLASIINFLFSQECDSGFVWLDNVPISCGGADHCFYEADLNILQEIIDNSSETINMLLDDNEDGFMEPVELGYTEWVNGRLVTLDCFLSDIMPCNLSGQLPANIGDLEYLEALWLNGNELSGYIPESIGNLSKLELLYLSNNHFSGIIPESLCNLDIDWGGENLWGVEYFNIWGNDICPPYPSCMDADIIGEQNNDTCMIGDVNSDGSLNILDIIIIANIILGLAEYSPESDVNQDGDLNILDIVSLANMILS